MATVAEQVQKIYIGLLGRAADKPGLEYWTNEIDSGALTLEQLRANIVNEQPEYAAGLGTMSRAQVVSSLYENLFERPADAEGLDYWVNGGGSSVNVDQLVLALIEGASAKDQLALDNKADVAEYYTEAAGSNYDEGSAAAAIANVGSGIDELEGRDYDSVAEAKDAIDGMGFGSTGIVKEFSDIAGDSTGEHIISDIGKAEWDAAGQATTTTNDYTFTLANQLGAEEQYTGTFLSPLFEAGSNVSDSKLFVQLLDVREAGSDEPLGNLPVDGIRFSLNGEEVVLRSDEIFNAKTYEQLKSAIEAAIADSGNAALSGFEVSIGENFTATGDSGQPIPGAVGQTIVLNDTNGGSIETGNFTYSEDASAGGFTLYGDQSIVDPTVTQLLTETSLELDNVGYGSQGGSVNLAGQSNTDVGVQKFNVDAKNGVWLSNLSSTSPSGKEFLEQIDLTGSGYFRVGTQVDQRVENLQELLAQGASAEYGLVDVQDFNGGNFDGDINLNAQITGDVVARDLNAVDEQAPSDDDEMFSYSTAAGDDQVSLNLSDDLMAREDASVSIVTNDGDDLVETVITDSGNDLTDQQLNANLTINTGAGDDVVRTWGEGDAEIFTGSGNDVVYADNTGVGAGSVRDVWEFNSTAGVAGGGLNAGAPNGQSNSDVNLSNGANGVAQVYNGYKLQVQVSFKGFESTYVTIENSDDYQVSTLQINQAIKEAVNNDDVLSKLIAASDGDGNVLNIESLIDGNNLDQLTVEFFQPLASGANAEDGRTQLTTADEQAITDGDIPASDVAGIEAIYAEDGATQPGTESAATDAGADSIAESDNTIHADAGDDVLVLGTGEFSNDTVVLEGNFGNDTVVNFTAGAVAGGDILDFTAYGVTAGTVANNATGVADDQVSLTDVAALGITDATFGNLTAADIDTHLGAAGTAGAANGENSIMLVQDGTTGNYKAFDVNLAEGSTDYQVELIGTLDFGASQVLDAANIA